MTCAQGLLRLLWGGPKLECYGIAVSHSDELLVPKRCEVDLLSLDNAESTEESSISKPCTDRDDEFVIITCESHSINESELNDFASDLDLPKVEAELLASRLKQ